MRQIIGALVLCGLAASVQAQELRGAYAGLSIGNFRYEQSGDGIFPIRDGTSSYRVLGGYQFNSSYAIEATWGATGDVGETFYGFDPGIGDVSFEISGDYEIATLRFIAVAPFSRMNMFGGGGYYDATSTSMSRLVTPNDVVIDSFEDSDSGLTVVGGLQYEFDRITLRGEYEWFDTESGVEASNIAVSALFRF